MERGNKKEVLVKLGCLLAAFSLWIFVTGVDNPVKTKVIKDVNVKLLNTRDLDNLKLALNPNQIFKVDIKVSGTAADIYGVSSDDFKLVADLGMYALKSGSNYVPITIEEIPKNISVIKDDGMWIDLKLDKLINTTVPATVKLEGESIRDDKMIRKPNQNITEANIKGAESLVKRVSKVEARVNINDVEDAGVETIPLVAVDDKGNIVSGIDIEPKNIEVTLNYDTVKSVPIKVKTIGDLQDGLLIKNIEYEVKEVSIAANDSVLEGINEIYTEDIDISKITGNQNIRAKLTIPKGVSIVGSTDYVDVTIKVTKIDVLDKNVNIETKNVPNERKVILTNNRISVKLKGEREKLINISDLSGYVDCSGLDIGEYDLKVEVSIPSGMELETKEEIKVKVVVT